MALSKAQKFCKRKARTGKKSVDPVAFLNCLKNQGKGRFSGYSPKRRRKARRSRR